MDNLSLVRRQQSQNVLQQFAHKAYRGNYILFNKQRTAMPSHAEIYALPASYCGDVQDLDPESPNFGNFLYSVSVLSLGQFPLG